MKVKSKITERELRNFGIVVGTGCVVLFGVVLPTIHRTKFAVWPWIVAAMLWVLFFFYPKGLNVIYKIWMTIGHVLGWVNTRLILAIIFFVIITPVGLLLRFFGRDPLTLRKDDKLETYRIMVKQGIDNNNMENPF